MPPSWRSLSAVGRLHLPDIQDDLRTRPVRRVDPPRRRTSVGDRANRMPTAASYLCTPDDDTYRAVKFDVLRTVDGLIAEITTFDAHLFPAFGLPPTLD